MATFACLFYFFLGTLFLCNMCLSKADFTVLIPGDVGEKFLLKEVTKTQGYRSQKRFDGFEKL